MTRPACYLCVVCGKRKTKKSEVRWGATAAACPRPHSPPGPRTVRGPGGACPRPADSPVLNRAGMARPPWMMGASADHVADAAPTAAPAAPPARPALTAREVQESPPPPIFWWRECVVPVRVCTCARARACVRVCACVRLPKKKGDGRERRRAQLFLVLKTSPARPPDQLATLPTSLSHHTRCVCPRPPAPGPRQTPVFPFAVRPTGSRCPLGYKRERQRQP